ncbi:MOSC domain-containing protein [Thozetella sp. PMI_491]|nr:MOSC domain-containing protein [Thozetella sp. PMI_491]
MSVHALAVCSDHKFTKPTVQSLNLLTGLGVEGDCHLGVTVQHRSRLHIKPPPANLRQVHLIPLEILEPLGVRPGQIGENVTTTGVDLLSLGTGAKLHFLPVGGVAPTAADGHAIVVVQGVRNPCPQIDKYRKGLKECFIVRDADRNIVARRAGVMGTVEVGGPIRVGMSIFVEHPESYQPLQCV